MPAKIDTPFYWRMESVVVPGGQVNDTLVQPSATLVVQKSARQCRPAPLRFANPTRLTCTGMHLLISDRTEKKNERFLTKKGVQRIRNTLDLLHPRSEDRSHLQYSAVGRRNLKHPQIRMLKNTCAAIFLSQSKPRICVRKIIEALSAKAIDDFWNYIARYGINEMAHAASV